MTSHEHTQHVSLTLHVPEHAPRSGKAYAEFRRVRERLRAQGLLTCVVCGDDGSRGGQPIELHHSHVEWSLQNGVAA